MTRYLLALILTALSPVLVGQDLEDIVLKEAGSGTDYELNSIKSSRATVIIFWGNRCAYNSYYVERVKKLVNEFKAKNIRFILINAYPSDIIVEESQENMQLYLKDEQLSIPYLVDAQQKLKTSLGATRSPEAFLLSGNYKVVYSGAIDDSPASEGDVNHYYLRAAILSLLENEKPKKSQVKPVGCLIR